MAQVPSRGLGVRFMPQPDIYTLMLIIAGIALATTIAVCLGSLMAAPPAGYGLGVGEFFEPLSKLVPG